MSIYNKFIEENRGKTSMLMCTHIVTYINYDSNVEMNHALYNKQYAMRNKQSKLNISKQNVCIYTNEND